MTGETTPMCANTPYGASTPREPSPPMEHFATSHTITPVARAVCGNPLGRASWHDSNSTTDQDSTLSGAMGLPRHQNTAGTAPSHTLEAVRHMSRTDAIEDIRRSRSQSTLERPKAEAEHEARDTLFAARGSPSQFRNSFTSGSRLVVQRCVFAARACCVVWLLQG